MPGLYVYILENQHLAFELNIPPPWIENDIHCQASLCLSVDGLPFRSQVIICISHVWSDLGLGFGHSVKLQIGSFPNIDPQNAGHPGLHLNLYVN